MTAQPVSFYQVGTFAVGNRLLGPAADTVQADAERTNSITSGHRACQGCGEALGARYVLDAAMRATGGAMVAVNATGCLEVFSTPYPESSWRVPWLHSLFGNAPAVAAGVAAALKVKGRTDVRVVGQAGDGGAVDIGFACLSGMFERNDDVLFVCYDNQGYMNTGVQRSGATPPAARTSTTPVVGDAPGNVFGQGKSAPLIAMAHEIPYVATATVADLRDLEAKVARAMAHARGALPARARAVPARLGDRGRRHDPGRPAGHRERLLPGVRGRARRGRRREPDPTSGAGGRVPAAADPLRPPVLPDRTGGHHRGHPGPRRPQHPPVRPDRRRTAMNNPFAITLTPGSSRANHTGAWRTERPVYVDLLPPCNNACPAGENIQRWLYLAESGDYETAWRELMRDNPFPAIMGRVCYHPCQTACNRASLDEAVGINSVERFLGDEALRQGWTVGVTAPLLMGARQALAPAPGTACSSSAPAPPGWRRPTTFACSATT